MVGGFVGIVTYRSVVVFFLFSADDRGGGALPFRRQPGETTRVSFTPPYPVLTNTATMRP